MLNKLLLNPRIDIKQKYTYSIKRQKTSNSTIDSLHYNTITTFITSVTSKLEVNTPITIKNGKLTTIIDGGILIINAPQYFKFYSLVLLNSKHVIKNLYKIRMDGVIHIEQNNIRTTVCHYDNKKISAYLTFTNNLPSATNTIIQNIGTKKSSLNISRNIIIFLQREKLEYNAKYFTITVDKDTFEILAIYIIDPNNKDSFHREVFNKKYLSDYFTNFDSYKVRDLFPITAFNSKYPTFSIDIFSNNTSIYINTSLKSTVDINYCFNASKTTAPAKSINNQSTSALNTFRFTVNTKDVDFKLKLFDFIKSQNLLLVTNDTKIKMYSYTLDKSKDIKALEVYKNDQYILNLKDKGRVFFTLKVTNKFDYTFSFNGLSELVNYVLANNINGERSDISYANSIINSDELIIEQRMKTLKDTLKFLKENNLYSDTKIKTIGFSKSLKDSLQYKDMHLIKYNTSKAHPLYNYYSKEEGRDTYSSKIHYYKAYIKYPKDIVKNFNELTDQETFKELREKIQMKLKKKVPVEKNYNGLTDTELLNELSYNLREISREQRKLRVQDNIIVAKDSSNHYYIKVSVLMFNKKYTNILLSKRNLLEFKLDIDNKSDYFKISHTNKYTIKENLYRTYKEPTPLQCKNIPKENIIHDVLNITRMSDATQNELEELKRYVLEVAELFHKSYEFNFILSQKYKIEQKKLLKNEKEEQQKKDTQAELKYKNDKKALKRYKKDKKSKEEYKNYIKAKKQYKKDTNAEKNYKMYTKEIYSIQKNLGNVIELPKINLKKLFKSFEKELSLHKISEKKYMEYIDSFKDKLNAYFLELETTICQNNLAKESEIYKWMEKEHKALQLPANPNKFNYTNEEIQKRYVKEENFKLKVNEQLNFSFKVNRWDTTHKNILTKYNKDKKHYFALDDDIEDIVQQIIKFTSKYQLLEIKDKKLLEKVKDEPSNHFKTKKKFQDAVINNPNTQVHMQIDKETLTQQLQDILQN